MKKIIVTSIFSALFLYSCSTSKIEVKPEKVNNVILLIGDGMGLSQIQAAMTVNHGSLNMLGFPVIGLVKTQSADNYITDSAAGGTAMSTGTKTNNGAIGMDTAKVVVKTLVELAEAKGLATGLVSTSSVTHATPASFIAHQPSRHQTENIAADFLNTDIDIFIGGGLYYFKNRRDGKDLTDSLISNGYGVYTSIDLAQNAKEEKLAVLTSDRHNKMISEDRGDMLLDASKMAIKHLNKSNNGFFLMIEGSQIDWGGHNKDQDYVVSELLDFDKSVGWAKEFAAKNEGTLVIVTADHETGGMIVVDGDIENGTVQSVFTHDKHTGTMVPLFAFGAGAKNFSGVYENTEIFEKIKALLNL